MENVDLSLVALVMLIVAAFLAGYIDTLVGGGGLITIPALLAAGLPPVVALGTNKLQAVAGSGTATLTLMKLSKLSFENIKWLMCSAFGGAIVGALAVQYINSQILNWAIPLVMVFIAVYFIFSSKQAVEPSDPRISKTTHGLTSVPAIGFYDGFLGPGTGSFFVWSGVALRGQSITLSTMVAKPLNFATNIAALTVFISFGKIAWALGFSMMIGQVLGARLGAKSLISVNPDLLRYLVIAMCAVMLIWWAMS